MDDQRILEQLQTDHSDLSTNFATLGSNLATLSAIMETKFDSVIAEIRNLSEQDKALHERITNKNDIIKQLERNIANMDKDISVLKAKSINNQWWIGLSFLAATSVGTVLAVFF